MDIIEFAVLVESYRPLVQCLVTATFELVMHFLLVRSDGSFATLLPPWKTSTVV